MKRCHREVAVSFFQVSIFSVIGVVYLSKNHDNPGDTRNMQPKGRCEMKEKDSYRMWLSENEITHSYCTLLTLTTDEMPVQVNIC